MKPISNKINLPILAVEIVLFCFFVVERDVLGGPGFISTLFILSLTVVSTVVTIKARINWERNRDYQEAANRKEDSKKIGQKTERVDIYG